MPVSVRTSSIVALAAVALIGVAVLPNWTLLLGQALDFFQQQQRIFHDDLATRMHAIRVTGSWASAVALIGIGFAYGVFHAVGPGHGKLVVTSYLLAERSSLRRGVAIAVLASLLQGLVAIAVVLGLFLLLGLARAQTERAAFTLETVSFVLIAVLGLRLVLRGAREAWQLTRPPRSHNHDADHQHGCGHDESGHVHDAGCSHAHLPAPDEIVRARSVWSLALMVLSIGIRPCSGAIILLLFACLIGVVGPGVVAVLALSAGTALTTAALAIAAVRSKRWILRAMRASDRSLAVAHAGLALAGGLLVMATGIFFTIADARLAVAPAQQDSALPTMHLPDRSTRF